MSHALLSRAPAHTAPTVPLIPGGPELTLGRVHEMCGGARRSLALWLAAQMRGPVLWIAPAWEPEALNPCGIVPFLDPARLLLVRPKRPEDLLWSMEEALRAGIVPLIVADLPGLPSLTQVRRMHLAAEGGSAPPLGVLLTPGQTGGAPGVESRWRLDQAHQGGTSHWTLERLRARTAPVKSWTLHRPPGTALPTPA
ncbi:MAG: hypothetical protein AAFY38_10590 [Pseudomonadota bacterium]